MGLGKWVVGLVQKDPTRDWPARSVSALEFDTSTCQLSGITLDSPIDSARPFGPADQCSGGADDPDFDYRALGLQVACFDGILLNVRVIMAPAGRDSDRDRAFQPGELELRTGGRSLRLTGRTTEQDVIAQFGEPIETGPVGNDRVHSFLVERCLIDTYHDPGTGALVEVMVALRDTDDVSSATKSSATPS